MTTSNFEVAMVEQLVIGKKHKAYNQLDELSYRCKNLYNAVLYEYRKIYFKQRKDYEAGIEYTAKYDSWQTIATNIKHSEDYISIGNAKIAQQVIKQVCDMWFSWLKALKSYYKNPAKFTGKPRIPKYKDKESGRSKIMFNNQTISKKSLRNGLVKLALIDHEFVSNIAINHEIACVVVNKTALGRFKLDIVYKKIVEETSNPDENGEVYKAGIDLGVNVISAVAMTNGKGLLFDGKQVKHINKKYNDLIADAQSKLPKNVFSSHKIKNLYNRRNNKIKDAMHKISSAIINELYDNHIYEVYVGHNDGWKQNINIGRTNNRTFVSIPFNTLIHMLTYKGKLKSIEVKTTEEAYTSKASAIDKDQLFKYGEKEPSYKFSGSREKHGLYISKDGYHAHADMNGAWNILRKNDASIDLVPNYDKLCIGCLVRPEYVRVAV